MDSSKSIIDWIGQGAQWLNSNGNNNAQQHGSRSGAGPTQPPQPTNSDLMAMLCRLERNLQEMQEGIVNNLCAIASSVSQLRCDIEALGYRLSAIEDKLMNIEGKTAAAQSAAQPCQPEVVGYDPEPQQELGQILYGGMLDDSVMGFDVDSLVSDASIAGRWIEITVTGPSTATYRAVPSPIVREQMTTNFEAYIEPAFDYGGERPFSMNGIEDVEPGQLVLQGNVWKIVSKAKIRIV